MNPVHPSKPPRTRASFLISFLSFPSSSSAAPQEAASALDQTIHIVGERANVVLLDENERNGLIVRLAKDLNEVCRRIVGVNKEMLMDAAKSTEKDQAKLNKLVQGEQSFSISSALCRQPNSIRNHS